MLECDIYIREEEAKGKVWTDEYGFIYPKRKRKMEKILKRYI